MTISPESVRALERHFVGTLSLPSRLWLDCVPLLHVVVTGSAALCGAGDGCAIDLGTVESPGAERQVVRIAGARPEVVEMKLGGVAPWLTARWLQVAGDAIRVESRAGAELELTATHDVLKKTDFAGVVGISIRDAAGDEWHEELPVLMTARRTQPLGEFNFHGTPQPRGFDFGTVDPLALAIPPYELSFDSLTSVPLTVVFADLPAWLTFEVGVHRRTGPTPGRFFERDAPFTVAIRPRQTPDLIGAYQGSLHLETNDPRLALRSIDIRFSVCLEPAGPFLRAVPDPVLITASRPLQTDVRLENWGRTPARVAVIVPPAVQVIGGVAAVPAAAGGRPGVGSLRLRVVPSQLSPGTHLLPLTLNVEGAMTLQVTVPVQVAPGAVRARKRGLALAAMAALFALLAFALLIV
ncbi:MAG TPA: hypothetical protein VF713_27070, partial [Thermoanaerobaculia bacterium]